MFWTLKKCISPLLNLSSKCNQLPIQHSVNPLHIFSHYIPGVSHINIFPCWEGRNHLCRGWMGLGYWRWAEMGANLSTSTSRRLTLAPQFCCVGPIAGEHRWAHRGREHRWTHPGRASLGPLWESIVRPTGEHATESSREFAALGTLRFHKQDTAPM